MKPADASKSNELKQMVSQALDMMTGLQDVFAAIEDVASDSAIDEECDDNIDTVTRQALAALETLMSSPEMKVLADVCDRPCPVLQEMRALRQRKRETVERLDLALWGINEGIWDWWLQENRVIFDDRYFILSGYAPGEFPSTYMQWENRIFPADLDTVKTAIEQYLNGKTEAYDVEFRFLHKDGHYMWIHGKGQVVSRDATGAPVRFIGTHSDITARKQMEQSLRLTQFGFDHARVGIYRLGADSAIMEVNQEATRMLGYTREELTHMSVYDIDQVLTRESAETFWRTVKLQGCARQESIHRHKDGHLIPVEIFSSRFEYDGEEYSITFAQDISDRKQAQQALEKNERLLSNILESVTEGVVAFDPDLRYQIFNRSMEQITGISRQKVLGKSIGEAFPMLMKTDVVKNLDKALRDEKPDSLVINLRNEADTNIWLKDSFSSLKDEVGKVVGVVGIVTDITQQKHDEDELRKLRNYLNNIINSMPSVLVAVDKNGIVTQWNNRTAEITGLNSETAKSQPLCEVFPELGNQMDRIKTAISERKVIHSAKEPRKHDHEHCYENITIFPLVANGVEGAVIRVDDVTHQVQMDEMMIQSEKMLSMGGLAAGMAHEINNPLAGILQNIEVMKNRLLGELPGNQAAAEQAGITLAAIRQYSEIRHVPKMIDGIQQSGSRAAEIVINMLNFARKSERHISEEAIDKLLDDALELVRTDYNIKKHYDVKQIIVEREYDPDVPSVPCDPGKLQQVFMNILKNGAEAMSELETPIVPPTFRLRIANETKWVRIEIEDNGPGVPEAIQRRIFEPFFTTKPTGEGTGLGLSVSYFIITSDHGGELSMHEAKSGGGCFVIRLPKTYAGPEYNF